MEGEERDETVGLRWTEAAQGGGWGSQGLLLQMRLLGDNVPIL